MGAMTTRRWIEYLVAILAGNAIYFLILYPALPPLLRQRPADVPPTPARVITFETGASSHDAP